MATINHAVTIDMSKVVEGENTFACTLCQQNIVLMWDGQYFSLPDSEANDSTFGEVAITYNPPA